MSLRNKTLLYGTLTIISLVAILYFCSRLILLRSFAELEDRNAREDMTRVMNAFASDRAILKSAVAAFSISDSLYAYVQGTDPSFPKNHFNDETFNNLNLNLIMIQRCTGEIFYSKAFDLIAQQEVSLPETITPSLAKGRFFNCSQHLYQATAGLLRQADKPILLAAHPIVKSDGTGPVQAVLIFGYNLDAIRLLHLAEVTKLPVRLRAPQNDLNASADEIQVEVLNDETVRVIGSAKGINGQPGAEYYMDLPREIYLQGQVTLKYFLWSLLLAGIAFTLVILFPLENLLLRRLTRLNENVQRISASCDRCHRLDESGQDEISSLANEINKMLSALEAAEKQVRAVERRNILNAIPDVMLVMNRQGDIVEVKSDQDCFLKIPVAEIVGKNLRDFELSEATLNQVNSMFAAAGATKGVQIFEKDFFLPEIYNYEFRMMMLGEDEALLIARDISDRKRAEELLLERNEELQASAQALKTAAEALQESEERYSLAVRGANDGLWDWDIKANKVYFSPRWKSMLGYSEDEIGDSPEEWLGRLHPEEAEQVTLSLSNHLRGLTPQFESEHRIRHKDGSYRWVLTRGLAVHPPKWELAGPVLKASPTNGNGNGKFAEEAVIEQLPLMAIRMAGSQTDITPRKQAEEQLLHDAFHDTLTGLPNRALFLDRLGRAIERANRHPDNPFAVLFLDLDRFKVINDSLGHATGDQLLVALARRLHAVLRNADTVARLGGDEFVILLEDLPYPNEALRVAERIQEQLKLPFNLSGHSVVVTVSIGIVADTASYIFPAEVLRDADIAMYHAKSHGKDCFEIFNASLRTRAIARLEMESELRQALENGDLYLHYQPILSLADDQLIGFEALLRWESAERGSVQPSDFIPVAEETGLIVPIGEWVLREACSKLLQWQQLYPMAPPLTMNVNISGVQFSQQRIVEQVIKILQETGLSPQSLKLEITETVFMDNAEHANDTLLKLRDLGVQLEIDDFGTGYSSLAYLQHFPIHTIKIDRSFIARMGLNEAGSDASGGGDIVKTIVALARDLGMEAIAEGVETSEQMNLLKELKCQYGQGYLIARPMDGKGVEALLAKTPARDS